MNILFDQGTPVPLRHHLPEHTVSTAYERGWANLSNGDLLAAAEQTGYQLFIVVYPSGRETHALQPWEERPRFSGFSPSLPRRSIGAIRIL